MRLVYADEHTIIPLGKYKEDHAVKVLFDVKEWPELYGSGHFELFARRYKDKTEYPVVIGYEGDYVTWVPTVADTCVVGAGECELVYKDENKVAKSVTYYFNVNDSVTKDDGGNPPPYPERGWVEEVLDAAESVKKAFSYYKDLFRVAPYKYRVLYDRLDYEKAYKWFKQKESVINAGGCSAIRNGNYFGGQYDWKYDDGAEFIVSVPRIGDRYASVGIAGSVSGLTDEAVLSGETGELFAILPFQILDGINEHGLVAKMNVVPTDNGKNKALPTGENEVEICANMLIRYLLDHFDNASDAVHYVQEHMTVYFPKALHDMDYEVHYMVADANETWLVEFADNATVIEEMERPYMTNFVLNDVLLNADGTVYTPETQDENHDAVRTNNIMPHGSGLERYNLIAEEYVGTGSYEGMRGLLDELKYTKAYSTSEEPSNPYWYTEFVGGDVTCASAVEEYTDAVAFAGQKYLERSRETGFTWQTVHSVIYDIEKRSAKVIMQEDGIEIEFACEVDRSYQKPDTGIPYADLSSDLQSSIDKADSSVQDVQINGESVVHDRIAVIPEIPEIFTIVFDADYSSGQLTDIPIISCNVTPNELKEKYDNGATFKMNVNLVVPGTGSAECSFPIVTCQIESYQEITAFGIIGSTIAISDNSSASMGAVVLVMLPLESFVGTTLSISQVAVYPNTYATKTQVGTLSNLTTTAKNNLVAAVNEVKADVDSKAEIDDTTPAADKVYSSQKVSTDLGQKADKTALAETDESLDLLWKLTKGQAWDVTADNNEAYSKTIPSGTHLSVLKGWGGKSIVWNQLVKNGNFSDTNHWSKYDASISVGDGIATITKTSASGGTGYISQTMGDGIVGHKLFYAVDIKADSDILVSLFTNNSAERYDVTATSNWQSFSKIITFSDASWMLNVIWNRTASPTDNQKNVYARNFVCFDLTAMFGAGNEPSTVDQFRAMFPANYYPYSEPTLMSADVVDVVLKDDDSVTVKTLNVPASVRALEGYGWSAGSVANTVEYDAEQGKWFFHKRVASVDLGTLTWTPGWTNAFYSQELTDGAPSINVNTKANITSEKYVAGNPSSGDAGKINYWTSSSNKRIGVCTGDTSVTPTGTVHYELETPVVTDITALMTGFENYIRDVEPGGSLTFVNSHGDDYRIPVPSSVDHYRNLSEVTP